LCGTRKPSSNARLFSPVAGKTVAIGRIDVDWQVAHSPTPPHIAKSPVEPQVRSIACMSDWRLCHRRPFPPLPRDWSPESCFMRSTDSRRAFTHSPSRTPSPGSMPMRQFVVPRLAQCILVPQAERWMTKCPRLSPLSRLIATSDLPFESRCRVDGGRRCMSAYDHCHGPR